MNIHPSPWAYPLSYPEAWLKNGTVTATLQDLKNQCLDGFFKPGNQVYVYEEPDTEFYLISKNRKAWFSIFSDQIKIHEQP